MSHILKSKVAGTPGKFATLVTLEPATSQYGEFLTNNIPRESVGSMDKYYVVNNPKAGELGKTGKPKATHLLKVRPAGEQKSRIITGLFSNPSKYGKGNVLSGTDQNSKIVYMVVEAPKARA